MLKSFWTLLAALLLATPAAWPQASSTTVRGTVHDQAQAVVSQASVKLTNTATNVVHTTKTNEAGLYVFPGLIPGASSHSSRTFGRLGGMLRV